MNNIIKFKNDDPQDLSPMHCDEANDLISITENVLLDVKTDISQSKNLSMPISQLSTLGVGVASLLPAFRTVTQTSTVAGEGLFRLANAAVGDTLKVAKNGNFWGAFKTVDGASKFAQLQSAGPLQATNSIVMPIDPATMMMAVALFSIEQQLGSIAEMQKKILSFLEIEKESEIEADIETLSNIIEKYKHNWDNEQFITSNHKMVTDIQRTARKNMLSYQKKVSDVTKEKKLIVSQNKIKNTLDELMKDFKYYRLSLFAFSMSSLLEIMLSGNFKEENILSIKDEIQKYAFTYRDVYGECSVYLEDMEKSSVESNLLKGVSATSKAVGKFIGSIPKIKDGQLDERLQEAGVHVNDKAKEIETDSIYAFAEMSNPGTNLFTDKMDDLIFVYNQTTDILFDNNNIYLIAS
ncbi:MAG: hypothetical protein UGF89_08005 [Acutalibacteraceae bacterium]|nr:hypothetical protein [Acutalibacteraceae bacterium]